MHGCVVSLIAHMYNLIVFLLSNSKWEGDGCNPGPTIKLLKENLSKHFHWQNCDGTLFKHDNLKLLCFGGITCSFVSLFSFLNIHICPDVVDLMRAVCLAQNNWCQTNLATPQRIILKGWESNDLKKVYLSFAEVLTHHQHSRPTLIHRWWRYCFKTKLLYCALGDREGVASAP